jgi:hypothetical protein
MQKFDIQSAVSFPAVFSFAQKQKKKEERRKKKGRKHERKMSNSWNY